MLENHSILVKLEANWKRKMSVLRILSSRTKNLKVSGGIPLNDSFFAEMALVNCMTKRINTWMDLLEKSLGGGHEY